MNTVDIDVLLLRVREALAVEDWDQAVGLVQALRPPDQAGLFGELPPNEQDQLLPRLDVEASADILEELDDEDAAEIAGRLETEDLARILDEMEPDEAADLLGDMPPQQAAEALAVMAEPEEVRPLLVYADDSAGGLMTAVGAVLRRNMTARAAIDHLRSSAADFEDSYYLFVVDREDRLVGVVSLHGLIVAEPSTLIEQIMDPDVIHVHAAVDQEEAARLMSYYDLLALPVVDDGEHLLGLITHDDLVAVLEQEATEDIYRLGGVPEEQPADAPALAALRSRLPWLVLNLGTALVSAAVLSLFENTIARVAVLAAFFPIVAGVSGSAGTQTLTVTVRGLALGQVVPRNALAALGRELLIGLANGLVLGGIVAGIALAWGGPPALGLIVGLATLLNMACAALAGVLVPLAMQLLKLDPALASPILVTTTTDSFGYFVYLGLATLLLVQLL